ncbi:thiamine phosphate synthase [Parvicella tangerina]|uniref:Thiamine-phosphate synthase n=1 Tax=Parvicella tangerina TaxID=2829795 RepID=A0A916JLX8_9FLAO|nr:thiamine phosphate synthase [Parvicella tangerina]CAG5078481.1 Thiamine-phosphate synthase [Parvicella tangerina]
MKLVVFSTTDRSLSEAREVTQMFEEGLRAFHIKKSGFERHEMEEYLKVIPPKYHRYIILHSNHKLRKSFKLGGLHLSRTHRKKKYNSWWKMFKLRKFSRKLKFTRTFSKLSSLTKNKTKYDYVFLGPIYDSISKLGHSGNFGNRSLKRYISTSKSPVYALGGITPDKLEECKELGFSGVCVLGYIWNNEHQTPIEAFREVKNKLKELEH